MKASIQICCTCLCSLLELILSEALVLSWQHLLHGSGMNQPILITFLLALVANGVVMFTWLLQKASPTLVHLFRLLWLERATLLMTDEPKSSLAKLLESLCCNKLSKASC